MTILGKNVLNAFCKLVIQTINKMAQLTKTSE